MIDQAEVARMATALLRAAEGHSTTRGPERGSDEAAAEALLADIAAQERERSAARATFCKRLDAAVTPQRQRNSPSPIAQKVASQPTLRLLAPQPPIPVYAMQNGVIVGRIS